MKTHNLDLKKVLVIAILAVAPTQSLNCTEWDKQLSNDDLWRFLDNETAPPCIDSDLTKRVLQRQDVGLARKIVQVKMSQESGDVGTILDELSTWELPDHIWGPIVDSLLLHDPDRSFEVWMALIEQANDDVIHAIFPNKFPAKALRLCEWEASKVCVPRAVFTDRLATEELAKKVFTSQVFNSYPLEVKKSLYNLFNTVLEGENETEIDSKVAAPYLTVLDPSVREQVLNGPQAIKVNVPVLAVLKDSDQPFPADFYKTATRFTWNVAKVISKFSPGLFDDSAAVQRIVDDIISGERTLTDDLDDDLDQDVFTALVKERLCLMAMPQLAAVPAYVFTRPLLTSLAGCWSTGQMTQVAEHVYHNGTAGIQGLFFWTLFGWHFGPDTRQCRTRS